jgi:hypothetical protein
VRRLAEVAGISPTAGRRYDWEAIEAVLGTGLPSDYKLMAESFPEGWFRMFAGILLPDSERDLLDDLGIQNMDRIRELPLLSRRGEVDFPFAAYPEPGGDEGNPAQARHVVGHQRQQPPAGLRSRGQ